MQVRKATGWRKCGQSGEEEGHRLCFSLSQLHSTGSDVDVATNDLNECSPDVNLYIGNKRSRMDVN